LYRALEYVRKNETSRNLVLVVLRKKMKMLGQKRKQKLITEYINVFTAGRVFPNFKIDFLIESEDLFGPEVVHKYAHRFRLSLNNVFVGSIHESHDFFF